MRGGCCERELLRMVDSEEAEVDIRNNLRRRRSFRRGIDTLVATAKQQRQKYGDEKKTDFEISAFHQDTIRHGPGEGGGAAKKLEPSPKRRSFVVPSASSFLHEQKRLVSTRT